MSHQPSQLGPYRVVRKLGEGGMGVVYQGEHCETGEQAAIKMLFAQMSQREGFRARFEVEIETLRKLHHPSIVRLIGFGEEQDALFYVMELVEGANLEELLRSGRRFTWQQTVGIGLQLCAALKHAHDRGIIHRDLKPANVMMAPGGAVKLSDFGIAKLYGNPSETVDGGVVGTANYMSPEQVEGVGISAPSDLYSLGSVFYALLAGRPPFISTSMHEMLRMQVATAPEPLHTHVPEVPREVEVIVMRLLEKRPKDRYPSAGVLGRALEMAQKAVELRWQTEAEAAGQEAIGRAAGGSAVAMLGTDTHRGLAREDVGRRGDGDMGDTAGGPLATLGPSEDDGDSLELELDADVSSGVTSAAGDGAPAGGDGEDEATVASGAYRCSDGAARVTPTPTSGQETVVADAALLHGGQSSGGHGAARASFITAEDADLLEAEAAEPDPYEQANRGRLLSLLIAVAVVALLAGALAWVLQPPDEATLYARIAAYAASDDLRMAEADVRDFLERFPESPEIEQIRDYEEQIELLNLERRLRARAVLGRHDASDPLEELYLQAISHERLEPERAHAMLEALLNVYGAAPSAVPEQSRPYLELAQRKVAMLAREIRSRSGGHLMAMARMLEQAEQAAGADPAMCRRICQGVIELYGDKPWAEAQVARARRLVQRVADAAASEGP